MALIEHLQSSQVIKEIEMHLLLQGFSPGTSEKCANEVVTFCRVSWLAAGLEIIAEKSEEGLERAIQPQTYDLILPGYTQRLASKTSTIYSELGMIFAEHMRTAYK